MPWLMLATSEGDPPKTFGFQVSRWLSKWMTVMGPYSRLMDRSRGSVMVWSPPRVMTRGSVLPPLAGPTSLAAVEGARERML